METISCHSNQSSNPTRIKKKTLLFVPPAFRCYMYNMERIGLTALEEMSFENVDDERTDGGRTDAGCMYIL